MKADHSRQMDISVLPATSKHWTDVKKFFSNVACWCQYWRFSASEYGRMPKGEEWEKELKKRRNVLRTQLDRPNPPGILAYTGDELVGWCGIGVRQEMMRLVRSRTIPAIDERPVWAIVCFLVKPGYRRRGVGRALLRGAIECARSHKTPALEAYPVDPGTKHIDSTFAYVGTSSMFEREGFQRIALTTAHSAGCRAG